LKREAREWRSLLDYMHYGELLGCLLDPDDNAALRAQIEGMPKPPTGLALLDLIAEHLTGRYGPDPMELIR
jgi:hypothetical protein